MGAPGYLPKEEIEGPPIPGSADDFIAGVNAQPLAAPIAPEIPPEAPDEAAFPPPVPPEAPGMVSTAPALPIPTAPPASGPGNIPLAGPAAANPPPIGSIADVSQAGQRAIESRRKADQAQLGVLEAGTKTDEAQTDLATEKSDNARLEQADIEDQLKASKAAEGEAQKIYDQAAAAKRNFKFRNLVADKPAAVRLASAISVAFGAYAAGMNHTQNYALDILNKQLDDDHRDQIDRLNQLSDQELQARTGLADVHAARVQALTDIGTKYAALNRRIAASADQVAATKASAEDKAKLQAFAADLNARADETEYTTKQGIYKSVLANEAGRLKNENLQAQTRLLNAKAGKLAGAGVAGARNDAAIAELARYAEQPGVTQADLVAKATQLGIKKPLDVVVKVAKDPEKIAAAAKVAEEKEAAAEVRDTNGNVLGVAASPRAAAPLNSMVAASKSYKDAIEAYRAHIIAHGREINPFSDDYKERERLHADVVSKGRPFMQLGVSNANLQLEHQAVGGAGTGFSRMSSPESLAKLADEVDKITNARIKTALHQPRGGGAQAPAPESAPAPAADLITIKNNKTGETKQVTRAEAKAMGAIP